MSLNIVSLNITLIAGRILSGATGTGGDERSSSGDNFPYKSSCGRPASCSKLDAASRRANDHW